MTERFRSRESGSSAAVAQAVAQWLAALRTRTPLATISTVEEGLCVTEVENCRLRTAYLRDEMFFACEFDDAHESWQCMLVCDASSRLRGGWRRIRGAQGLAPAEWHALVSGLALDADGVAGELPDFLAFAAIAAHPGLTLRREPRIEATVEDDASHWRHIAKQQAPLLRAQRLALRQRKPQSVEPAPTSHAPATLADLDAWAAARADQIVILPRAIAEAKRSHYTDVARVYDVLEMLAELYAATKKGTAERDALKQRCNELGLSIGRSVDPSRAGQAREEYFVTYKGRKRFLESHVGRGTSREPRFTLRIYFFYDEDDEVVVVGFLPTHLSNSMT